MVKTSKINKTCCEDFFDKLDIPLIMVKEDYMVFTNNAAIDIIGINGKLEYKYMSKYWKNYKEINEEKYLYNSKKDKVELKNQIIELGNNKKIKTNISLFNVGMLEEKYLCITIKNPTVSTEDFNKLKEDNKKIKNRDKRRTEFFANLSHDFRTPINVIYTAIQVMDIGVKNRNINAIKKYTKIMKQNCYRLLRLINNLIDATKIDAGYYDLNLENNDIVSLIEDIVTSVSGYVRHNDMDIIFDTDVEERILACDKDLIERAFLNLVSNAIKYKKKGQGEIFVNISTAKEMVSISVKDKGMGIPKEKQKIIFERFVQASASLDKNSNSSGIGLSLVKSIADMHNGTVELRSKEGIGSEFTIKLPIKLVENQKNKKNEMNVKSKKEKINIEFSDVYTIK